MVTRYTTKHERLNDKAAHLPTRFVGGGRFVVGSGSEPGLTYTVSATRTTADALTEWQCTCPWGAEGGRGCAHVRASVIYLAKYWRKEGQKDRAEAALAVLTPAPAMAEEAAA